MIAGSTQWSPGELRRVLAEHAGLDLAALRPATGGESRNAFWATDLPSDGTAITGVIDINPPVLAGDRAFDLATLLFYRYDHDDIRSLLHARLLELAGPRAACAYLAHMVLRQVDWSLRHHPTAAVTRHHLRLAKLIITDINRSPAP